MNTALFPETEKHSTMSLSLNEYKVKLINKILFATSQTEVEKFCDAAISTLKQNKVDEYMINRFVEKTIIELDQFSPMNKDAQQWSNISMAKIIFNRYKHKDYKPVK